MQPPHSEIGDDSMGEYRGQRFVVEARPKGESWTGHYLLQEIDMKQAREAADAGRHQWKSMDPGWATPNEARRNATEAAHAAIDALCR